MGARARARGRERGGRGRGDGERERKRGRRRDRRGGREGGREGGRKRQTYLGAHNGAIDIVDSHHHACSVRVARACLAPSRAGEHDRQWALSDRRAAAESRPRHRAPGAATRRCIARGGWCMRGPFSTGHQSHRVCWSNARVGCCSVSTQHLVCFLRCALWGAALGTCSSVSRPRVVVVAN